MHLKFKKVYLGEIVYINEKISDSNISTIKQISI